jgi:hypothetical protein
MIAIDIQKARLLLHLKNVLTYKNEQAYARSIPVVMSLENNKVLPALVEPQTVQVHNLLLSKLVMRVVDIWKASLLQHLKKCFNIPE